MRFVGGKRIAVLSKKVGRLKQTGSRQSLTIADNVKQSAMVDEHR